MVNRGDDDRGAIRTGGGHAAWHAREKESKPKSGRRRTDTLSISLKIALKQKLQKRCEELDVPVSEWVAQAIEEKMELDDA